MSKERIQKALARQGLGSRRQIESWIKDDLITLNGKPVKLGQLVESGDVAMYSGRKIIIRNDAETLPRVLMYHKPEGEVCSRSDPEGRPTIFESLPGLKHSRWVAVGRLDINTSGLILITDNGDLANKLMHPSSQLQREYAVRVMGKASAEQLKKLTHGVKLEDGMARFEDIMERQPDDIVAGKAVGFNRWYHVVLMEGRNREVRRMWEAVNLKVSRLMRVRYGSVMMSKSLRPGKYKELEPDEIRELAELAGIEYSKQLKSGKPVNKNFRMTKHRPSGRRGRATQAGSTQGKPGQGRSSQGRSSQARAKQSTSSTSERRRVNHGKRR